MPLAPAFNGTPYSAYPTAARATEGTMGALQQALAMYLQLKQQGVTNQLNQQKVGQEQQQIDISKGNLGVNQTNAATNQAAQQRLTDDALGKDAEFVQQNYGNQPMDNNSSTMKLLQSQPTSAGLIRPMQDYPSPQLVDRQQNMPGDNTPDPTKPAYFSPSMAATPTGQSYLPPTEDSKLRANYYSVGQRAYDAEAWRNTRSDIAAGVQAGANNRNDAAIKGRMAVAAMQNQAHLLGIDSNNYATLARIAEANALASANLDAKQYELYTKSPAFTKDLIGALRDPNYRPQFTVPDLGMPRPPIVPGNPSGITVRPSTIPPNATVTPSVQVP